MKTEDIAKHIVKHAEGRPRFIVAIAGPPGAGKTTLATRLLTFMNDHQATAKIVPMDGFHLDNSILNKRGLLERKGAPQTFDANGFVHLMMRLADVDEDVAIATFDRQRDISIAAADVVSSRDRILLVEGNYLLLQSQPWAQLRKIWDETVFINPGIKVLEHRLVDRWLNHGLNAEDARRRALSNDIPNAHYVLENSSPAQITIAE